jgi:hypothetical protein
MFLTSLYRSVRLALLACTLAFAASLAFAQSGQQAVPTPPTNLAATAISGKVTLSWTRVSGATSYTVYRSRTPGSGYAVIGTPIGSGATDTKVTTGTTYYYIVTAINAHGESPKTAQITTMTPIPANVPATPTNPAATAGNKDQPLLGTRLRSRQLHCLPLDNQWQRVQVDRNAYRPYRN